METGCGLLTVAVLQSGIARVRNALMPCCSHSECPYVIPSQAVMSVKSVSGLCLPDLPI